MTFGTLIRRGLTWYWRTHAAVVFGVAVAISVLAGSLLVGESVRASLRRMAVERLGRTDVAVIGTHFFRDRLAADLAGQGDGAVRAAAALIALDGLAMQPSGGRRAGGVHVFGVNDRFWRFHGIAEVGGPIGRESYVSPALARELGLANRSTLLVRVQQPSAIPAGVLQGRREDTARTIRTTVTRVLPRELSGEFSLSPGQGPVRAVFVPLELLQRELEQPDGANVIVASADDPARMERSLAGAARPADLGFRVEAVDAARVVSVDGRSGFLEGGVRAAVDRASGELGLDPVPVLTYIANTIAIGERSVPYSVVTAFDLSGVSPNAPVGPYTVGAGNVTAPDAANPPIWLNAWAARELSASPGDTVTLEYFRWSDEEGLTTHSASFAYAGSIPMDGAGGDQSLTPDYPGMTNAERMGAWDPPFPVDLSRIQPRDERYWDEYRTAPKAFLRYEDGRRLWSSRYGDATSLRLSVAAGKSAEGTRDALLQRLRGSLSPSMAGLSIQPVRARALEAARGSTDFGEYFVYFSFFLFVAGLILAALFFKLGVEGRASEIGLLHALGYPPRTVRHLFLGEGAALAAIGCALGVPGGIAFCALILAGLRTWWIGAVGTDQIHLHVDASSLVAGAAGGLVAAVVTTYFSVRALGRSTARQLIAGSTVQRAPGSARPRLAGLPYALWIGGLTVGAAALLVAASAGAVSQTPAFFAAGGSLLIVIVLSFSALLRRARRGSIQRPGTWGVLRLGARQTTWRPGRSVLVAALIAAATFVIVAVGAFRRESVIDSRSPQAGTGGFPLFAESLVPVMHDPGTEAGRDSLNFGAEDREALADVRIARFRLRPGDEASCLNLYRPTNPRILGTEDRFRREGRFTFGETLASTPGEHANPWLLLDRRFDDGAVPAIGDATSLAYALHRKVGDDLTIAGPGGTPVVLRIVGALADSVFQSELLVSDAQFVRLFPRQEGFRFFLIDVDAPRQAAVTALLEDRLGDLGLDVQGTVDRIEAYHRVERTYLSTFQTLGAFGLILGTLGLGAVLLRNVLERRRELALLRVVGYRAAHLRAMVLAESLLLLGAGVAGGTLAAVLAVAPALWERGGGPPWLHTAVLLVCVLAAGIVSSVAAARAATRSTLLAALRSE